MRARLGASGTPAIATMALLLAASVSAIDAASSPKAESKKEKTAEVKLKGYLEWRQGDLLIVDGEQVRPGPDFKFEGKGEATDPSSIPLGYECSVKGVRQKDGVVLASEIKVDVDGSAMFEKTIKDATDEMEKEFHRVGRVYEQYEDGRVENVGLLQEDGPNVDRVRLIMNTLLPPYVKADEVRVYVIENKDWNAFAMGNYAIYVYTGLLKDMDDDEVAIVLGHELVHATHEHSRRELKRGMWTALVALGIGAATESIDDKTARGVTNVAINLFANAFSNGFSRGFEDQADRVGLRYAYEAGYDITRAPGLWQRFATKYGEPGKIVNFFFGDHSRSTVRAEKLGKEVAFNYTGGARTGETRLAQARDAIAKARAAAALLDPAPGSGKAVGGPQPSLAGGGGGGQPKDVRVGMSMDEVRTLLGAPAEELVFGERVRWSYGSAAIVFEGGKVSEVK